MKEYRCAKDHKLLMRACLLSADVEIKCRACGHLNHFSADTDERKYLCYKFPCPHRIFTQE